MLVQRTIRPEARPRGFHLFTAEVLDGLPEAWFARAVPERAPYWTHTLEGDDDMPAHIKPTCAAAAGMMRAPWTIDPYTRPAWERCGGKTRWSG